ncbi:MAG: hypothetical protein J3Q66DRAFT_355408 [Benniella sp.]|nr:MAG: hypothetical protein J3Q66DRAFT_355408 [Benniella sp.]
MVARLRTKRIILCGVPITFELILRLVLLAMTLGILVAAAIPKIKSILEQQNVVSVRVTDGEKIPVPGTLVCGGLLDHVEIETLTRGRVNPDNTLGADIVRPVDPSMYRMADTSSLRLRANGDWPTNGKCVILEPKGALSFEKNMNGENSQAIETVIFVLHSKENFTSSFDLGLSVAVWDGNVNMADQAPIWIGIPSINTLTFVYSEHKALNTDKIDTRYTLTKQNLRMMTPPFFKDQTIIGRVIISPDTFFVTRYIDKASYTWVDLAGAIGGMASIAIAIWIFLFGSGKYKSWGVMQRYVLQTSPNSKRYKNGDGPSRTFFEGVKRFFRKLLLRLDSSADQELDHMPLKSSAQDRRRHSTRYSTAINTNFNIETAATTAAAAAVGKDSRNGARSYPDSGKGDSGKGGDNFDRSTARYSMDSTGFNNFYFTEQGTPITHALQPLAPINEGEDDLEMQVDELIQLIDLRIDERMWSLEKTLSRYYLDGFRLRNYSMNNRPYQGDQPEEEKAQRQQQQQYHGSQEDGTLHPHRFSGMPRESAHVELLQEDQPYSASPSPPIQPLYPPRPKVTHQYQFVDASDRSGSSSSNVAAAIPGATGPSRLPPGKEDISEISTVAPTISPSQSGQDMVEPGFPSRRNMRGTIRKAVERLQNEWPQTHSPMPPVPPVPYVPRTQYQSGGAQGFAGNNNNNTQGYDGSGGGTQGYGGYRHDNPPPQY